MSFTLEPGTVIAERYRLERLIGRGGMGEVWAAEQTVTRKRVAMKFLLGEGASNEDARRRFLREARAACAVLHPNVVQIYDVIEAEEKIPVIVMELLQGESLEAKLQRETKLTVDETLAILLRVISAVGTAHTLGIIHRDIKPDNIFLCDTAEGVEVKVLDFGIAKISTSEDSSATAALTNTGTLLGTPVYMSPEQAFGEKRIDHRADIWSLGIVMYRCLSGVLPTRAENLGQILKIIMTRSIPKLAESAPAVPRELAVLVDRMLGYAPADRPADLREVKNALDKIVEISVNDFGPPAFDAISLSGVTSPVPELSSGALALGGAALVALLTVAVVMWQRGSTKEDQPLAPVVAATSGDASSDATEVPSLGDVTPPIPTTAAVLPPAPSSVSSANSPIQGPVGARPQALVSPVARPSSVPSTPAPSAPPTSTFGGIVGTPGF